MSELTLDPDLEDEISDETDEERSAREELEVELDESSQRFVNSLIDKLLLIVDAIAEHDLYFYQKPFARRIIEALVLNEGSTLTAIWSRQSGKTETISNTVVACMIMFPRLAKVYPQWFGRFRNGLMVGAFAPVDEQADNLYKRMVEGLTSERALEFMADPDIDDEPTSGRGKFIQLKKSRSFIRKQTAHPRASIEGRTYHLILLDEAQGADERVVTKSINPMGASTNAVKVFTGTPTYTKGIFYRMIQQNKRDATRTRQSKINNFEVDWKAAAKANSEYGKHIKREMRDIGEDSDEFKLSYRLMWLLDKGMFTTSERIEELGDKSMQTVHAYHASPCVVGIDPARKKDSTIVTVVWVNWDKPDENGYYDHRILNWLDLTGMDWEEQYFRIKEFLSNYSILQAAVDEGGMGDVVVDRLRCLMPHIDWVPINSQRPEQSKRWKHLGELIRRGKIGWPAHAKTKRLKTWRRFRQQLEELELKFEGPYVLAQAPNETGAHDDYLDSLALACVLTKEYTLPTVEVNNNLFF